MALFPGEVGTGRTSLLDWLGGTRESRTQPRLRFHMAFLQMTAFLNQLSLISLFPNYFLHCAFFSPIAPTPQLNLSSGHPSLGPATGILIHNDTQHREDEHLKKLLHTR